ncbi:hypothetical protein BST85_13575 [Aureitalea marina]|uniref:DUF2490 domain-containing protein n=1 Tax=Aureitalea marina TaxID=930804 RepID=A0A2S7KT61_9FLAO|nr:hypothetical protein BST85_13575 [Aureitalea marina]
MIQAQSDPFVWQPEIDVNYQLNPDWNFNMGISYRSQVDFELRRFDGEISSSHIQWDAKANYRTGFRSHIGMTSMYRINQIADRQAENEFRLSEAYALDISFGKFSLGNRLQADQRFRFSTTLFRFRYQLSLDFPLSGERLDPGEFYTIFSTESLLTTASVIRPLWDQRFTGALGYELNKQWKLQLNFEFRAEGYNRGLIQRYFLYTRVIYAIPTG